MVVPSRIKLGGGFKHVLFSPLFVEDSHFDYILFKGVGTHQLVNVFLSIKKTDEPNMS